MEKEVRQPVLNRVDRILEIFFGLFMALALVGSVSVATAGRGEIRTMFAAALGCNLAWGLVDATMYLVDTITNRGRVRTLLLTVRATPDADAGRKLIERSLSSTVAGLMSKSEIEAIRARLVALPSIPDQPTLRRDDLFAAFAIFLIVVAATFPVALPFVLINNVRTAMAVSHTIALAMLFVGGGLLGRYAGYVSWKVGLLMMGLGTGLVFLIRALGG
jgi:hypothetical protein